MIIPYHPIPSARIRAHTDGFLVQCNIPETAWGPCGEITTLSGSLRLSTYARELLPAGAGGSATTTLEGFSPGTRSAITSTVESLRRRLEGSMHLEDFETPTPEGKGGGVGGTGEDRPQEGQGDRRREQNRGAQHPRVQGGGGRQHRARHRARRGRRESAGFGGRRGSSRQGVHDYSRPRNERHGQAQVHPAALPSDYA